MSSYHPGHIGLCGGEILWEGAWTHEPGEED